MNKKILLSFIALLIAFIPFTFAKAAEVKNLTVSQKDGKISVEGTAENDVLATVIQIYNEDESTLVATQTAYVSDDSTFTSSISVAEATYVVKVADYDGGSFVKLTVAPNSTVSNVNAEEKADATEEKTTKDEKTPETYDNIIVNLTLLVISILGITLAIRYKKMHD